MKIRAEAILDFVLAFIATVILAIGITRIWVWFNVNFASSQVDYQKGRLAAGMAPGGTHSITGTAATSACPSCMHQPLDLTEEWVFHRASSGSIGRFSQSGSDPTVNSQNFCSTQCASDSACTGPGGEFDSSCPCFVKCICNQQIKPTLNQSLKNLIPMCGERNAAVNNPAHPNFNNQANGDGEIIINRCGGHCYTYNESIDSANSQNNHYGVSVTDCGCDTTNCAQGESQTDITAACVINGETHPACDCACCGQICQLHQNAQSMRHVADQCSEPWDICWWFTWGKSSDRLKEAADNLDQAANQMQAEADRDIQSTYQKEHCCDDFDQPSATQSAVDLQQECLNYGDSAINCSDKLAQIKQNYAQLKTTAEDAISMFTNQVEPRITSIINACAASTAYCNVFPVYSPSYLSCSEGGSTIQSGAPHTLGCRYACCTSTRPSPWGVTCQTGGIDGHGKCADSDSKFIQCMNPCSIASTQTQEGGVPGGIPYGQPAGKVCGWIGLAIPNLGSVVSNCGLSSIIPVADTKISLARQWETSALAELNNSRCCSTTLSDTYTLFRPIPLFASVK